MRDILYPEGPAPELDPIAKARKSLVQRPLPKRFYQTASAHAGAQGFEVHLDGKPTRTPAQRTLSLPTRAAADLIAAEFTAMTDVIDPSRMPVTRLANSALDGVAQRMQEVKDEIAAYAASDLVCFRAGSPTELVQRQSASWDPVINWAKTTLGARFILAEGVIHVSQEPTALAAVRESIERVTDPCSLAALNVLTTISGSALIALMLTHGGLPLEEAWSAATVDERWNADLWGEDAEAAEKLQQRKSDFSAAFALSKAIQS
jgi:chaperone required for assembly of F1-ATPase